jgi:hypothetical protein
MPVAPERARNERGDLGIIFDDQNSHRESVSRLRATTGTKRDLAKM